MRPDPLSIGKYSTSSFYLFSSQIDGKVLYVTHLLAEELYMSQNTVTRHRNKLKV